MRDGADDEPPLLLQLRLALQRRAQRRAHRAERLRDRCHLAQLGIG